VYINKLTYLLTYVITRVLILRWSQVTASGPGLEKYCVEVDAPLEFTVDTRSAGIAPLGVQISEDNQQPVDVAVKDNQDGTYLCRYVPKARVKHVVVVTYGGVVIPNFPVRVSSC